MNNLGQWWGRLGQGLLGLLLTAIVARVAWELLKPLVPTLLGGALALTIVAYVLRR